MNRIPTTDTTPYPLPEADAHGFAVPVYISPAAWDIAVAYRGSARGSAHRAADLLRAAGAACAASPDASTLTFATQVVPPAGATGPTVLLNLCLDVLPTPGPTWVLISLTGAG